MLAGITGNRNELRTIVENCQEYGNAMVAECMLNASMEDTNFNLALKHAVTTLGVTTSTTEENL